MSEIREVLSGNEDIPDSRWEAVMKEAKVEGSKGEITQDEFIVMMQKLLAG